MNILILCTGNSCRSQMAEGFLKTFDDRITVVSAGTEPSSQVHPKAIAAMQLVNINISSNYPKSVSDFINQNFDYVITVCGGANQSCPTFTGNVKTRLHIGFDDPAEANGTDEEIMKEFLRIRNEIEQDFRSFYTKQIKPKL